MLYSSTDMATVGVEGLTPT